LKVAEWLACTGELRRCHEVLERNAAHQSAPASLSGASPFSRLGSTSIVVPGAFCEALAAISATMPSTVTGLALRSRPTAANEALRCPASVLTRLAAPGSCVCR